MTSAAALVGAQSDEFSGAPTDLLQASGAWSILHPERLIAADINTSEPGHLALVPSVGDGHGWFQDQFGPLVYKSVTGNFAVMVSLRVVSAADPQRAPSGNFNAGGIVVRDPLGTHAGNERWVMYNFGAQGPGGYARELKKTVPGGGSSQSNLFLNPQFSLNGHLLVCRVGQRFRFYHWNDEAALWQEEQYYNQFALGTSEVNPLGVVVSQLNTQAPAGSHLISSDEIDLQTPSGTRTPIRFDMSQMPQALQVGVMAHVYSAQAEHNTRGEFDYVRFAANAPSDEDSCVDAITPQTPIRANGYDVPLPIGLALLLSVGSLGVWFSRRSKKRV